MTRQIVKLQRPLSTNEPDVPWLLYGEGRTNHVLIPDSMVPQEVKDAMGDRAKRYYYGRLVDGPAGKVWQLEGIAPDQDW